MEPYTWLSANSARSALSTQSTVQTIGYASRRLGYRATPKKMWLGLGCECDRTYVLSLACCNTSWASTRSIGAGVLCIAGYTISAMKYRSLNKGSTASRTTSHGSLYQTVHLPQQTHFLTHLQNPPIPKDLTQAVCATLPLPSKYSLRCRFSSVSAPRFNGVHFGSSLNSLIALI